MSYDKCGAANVAGFFKVLAELKPKQLKAVGVLAIARNSCGEEGYVADEILTSRAGVRIRVGNTDAEGIPCPLSCFILSLFRDPRSNGDGRSIVLSQGTGAERDQSASLHYGDADGTCYSCLRFKLHGERLSKGSR